MPISFRCETCRRSIRVPDGSEGKPTRCPDCYSIQLIPFPAPSKPSPKKQKKTAQPGEVEDPLGITGKNESRWEPTYPRNPSTEDKPANNFSPPTSTSTAPPELTNNPFADVEAIAYEGGITAPYTTTTTDDEMWMHERAGKGRQTLVVLSVILMAISTAMIFLALVVLAARVVSFIGQPFQDPRWVARLAGGMILVGLQVATLFALNEARRLGNWTSAVTGMILSLLPCCNLTTLLLIPAFLPIWGLVLLFRPEIKAQFISHWDHSPE
ncbi:zinc ribbon domain-containing protein [Bremerella cremea]|uniref:Zinc finger/thioredoxin putative domain-containing protein n=1 Tax=Blastopirellula marina TaxID=124 RepID=A0A2S8FKJ2_9BACT|nr:MULTISPECIES: zinc ribbon domain-containing protein [Pirellulaceae]PQO32671.1 hypothetical protein C5Y83_20960 [Blastopirellula marina]RCS45738.1 zinc ribbon domain-containing protein [Bremerella cremea]